MTPYDEHTVVRFEVLGVPAPQGSTRAFVVGKRAVTTNKGSAKHMTWRDSVAQAARNAAEQVDVAAPLDGPMHLEIIFRFPMPKGRPKRVREKGKAVKTSAPDLDKLVRAVCDALQAGGLVTDDSRVCKITASKLEVVGWTGAEIQLTEGPRGGS